MTFRRGRYGADPTGGGGGGADGGLNRIGKALMVDPGHPDANDTARTGSAKYDIDNPYLTLREALLDAASGDVVLLAPGTHAITTSTAIGAGVAVVGTGARAQCIIDGSAFSGHTIQLNTNARLENVTVYSRNSASSGISCVQSFGTGAECHFVDIYGQNTSGYGFMTLSNCTMFCYDCRIVGGTFNHGWINDGNASSRMHAIRCEAFAGTVSSIVFYGKMGYFECVDCVIHELFDSTAGYGLYVGGTATPCDVVVNGLDIQNTPVNGVVLRYPGSSLDAKGIYCSNASGLDIYTNPAVNAAFPCSITESVFRRQYVDVSQTLRDGDDFLLSYFDPTTRDKGKIINGELSVGSQERGFEACFGRGDSTSKGMTVLTYDDSLTSYTDRTTEATSDSGSTFTFNTDANDALYIGHAIEFQNLKFAVTVSFVPGAGSGVWEYWNGSSWAAFDTMTTLANYPYTSYGNNPSGQTGDLQIRFGSMTGWSTTSVNGSTLYWVRFRVVTAITTAPTMEQCKLGRHRTEINADGAVEFFGRACEVATQPVQGVSLEQVVPLSGEVAQNRDINFANGINLVITNNRFAVSVDKAVGGSFPVTQGMHTALPVTFRWRWAPTNTDTGNVEFELTYRVGKVGDVWDGSEVVETVTVITAAPGTVDESVQSEADISIVGAIPGDVVHYSIARLGSTGASDTFTGDAELGSLTAVNRRWAL